jgi:hypothetical protein
LHLRQNQCNCFQRLSRPSTASCCRILNRVRAPISRYRRLATDFVWQCRSTQSKCKAMCRVLQLQLMQWKRDWINSRRMFASSRRSLTRVRTSPLVSRRGCFFLLVLEQSERLGNVTTMKQRIKSLPCLRHFQSKA